jgi:folate-binding protein YgfZ
VYTRDLSDRGRIYLSGPDRVRFLHGMLTNDIEALAPGGGCRAAMLTVKGKLLADLVVYADEERLLIELDGALREKIAGVLAKHVIMDDVEVEDASGAAREVGVYGDGAREAIERALGGAVGVLAPYHHVVVGGARVAAAPELAMPGYHVIGAAVDAGAFGGERLDDAAFEVLRVEAGTPRYGADMDEDRLVLEAGLDDAVSLTKGCYLGQEVVARATARGHINRKLRGLALDGAAAAAPGARVSGPGRDEAGVVTSSVVSPRFGAIALAYVHRTLWDAGTELTVHDAAGAGGSAGASARRAVVHDLPFRS